MRSALRIRTHVFYCEWIVLIFMSTQVFGKMVAPSTSNERAWIGMAVALDVITGRMINKFLKYIQRGLTVLWLV